MPGLEAAWVTGDIGEAHARLLADARTAATAQCFERDECQIDHIQPWSTGGLTIDSNGRAACGYHNRWWHRRTRPP